MTLESLSEFATLIEWLPKITKVPAKPKLIGFNRFNIVEGILDGCIEGNEDGKCWGLALGKFVGKSVGTRVGLGVGFKVGFFDGLADGLILGRPVGWLEGARLKELEVGLTEGCPDG